MMKRHTNKNNPVTRAIYCTVMLGLSLIVLHINAILVADSWSKYRTQGDLAVFSKSGSGIHIDPGDQRASN